MKIGGSGNGSMEGLRFRFLGFVGLGGGGGRRPLVPS